MKALGGLIYTLITATMNPVTRELTRLLRTETRSHARLRL